MDRRHFLAGAASGLVARHAAAEPGPIGGATGWLQTIGPAWAPDPPSPLNGIANLYALHSTFRLVTGYAGPLYKLRRETDSATLDVYTTLRTARGVIDSWLAGTFATVSIVYDQSGNDRTLVQPTANLQPVLDLSGASPTFDFDGLQTSLDGTTALSAFSQNAAGATVIALSKSDTTIATTRPLVFASTGTGVNRMALTTFTNGNNIIQGRRLDADALVRSTGFAADLLWHKEFGRWAWASGQILHRINGQDESANFTGSGNTSNTASTAVLIGFDNTTRFLGKLSAVAWISRSLSDAEVTAVEAAFVPYAALMPTTMANQFILWGSTPLTGATFSLAPGKTDYPTLIVPSGAAPTAADLLSHRYHHHTITRDIGSRQWVACSSALVNEDSNGQCIVALSTADAGTTWSAPLLAVEPQTTMSNTTGDANGRVCQCNSFQVFGGKLYLIASVESGTVVGLALVAVECKADGTLGTPFLITTQAYVATAPAVTINYDVTLGPPLLALAQINGIWGGSGVGQTPFPEFTGFTTQGGVTAWAEPCTFPLDGSGLNYQRLWRKTGGAARTAWWWSQISSDGGLTWSPLSYTKIPNPTTAGAALRLPDGRIAMTSNAENVTLNRDPLYLALYSGTTGAQQSIYIARKETTDVPTFAGAGKTGGAAYPGISYDGTNIWTSYSRQKESLGVSKIPLAGL